MFKITIEKITQESFKNCEWKPTGETKKDDFGKVSDICDYVYFDDVKEVKREILSQTVEELDIVSVVKAINKLE
jgi:hypothetical protein